VSTDVQRSHRLDSLRRAVADAAIACLLGLGSCSGFRCVWFVTRALTVRLTGLRTMLN
jgi:hypothetical protein